MCYDCGQQCFQHPPKRSSTGTPKNFKRQLVPLAFRETLKVSLTNWLLSAVIYKRRLLVTMDSSKLIIIFICVWLILSSGLVDHSQGFEVRLTKKTRRLKHKPRKIHWNSPPKFTETMPDFRDSCIQRHETIRNKWNSQKPKSELPTLRKPLNKDISYNF